MKWVRDAEWSKRYVFYYLHHDDGSQTHISVWYDRQKGTYRFTNEGVLKYSSADFSALDEAKTAAIAHLVINRMEKSPCTGTTVSYA